MIKISAVALATRHMFTCFQKTCYPDVLRDNDNVYFSSVILSTTFVYGEILNLGSGHGP